MPGALPVTPIYDNSGNLRGIEDPNQGVSRLPTTSERLLYGRRRSSGGSNHSNKPAPTQVTPAPTTTPAPVSSTPKPKTPQETEKLYAYYEAPKGSGLQSGTYTSTGQFYPDTGAGNKLTIDNYRRGYLYEDKNGISVISNSDVNSAKATQKGVVITKMQYDDTGVSRNINKTSNDKVIYSIESKAPKEEYITVKGTSAKVPSYTQLGAGITDSFIGTAEGLIAIGKTIKSNPLTFPYELGKKAYTGTKEAVTKGLPEVSELIREKPAYTVGYALGEVIQLKLPDIIVSANDIRRTTGLTEIPKEKVIAPEYFEGQRYPKIKNGQTAGDLLSEFKPILPGEVKAAGYTASPNELKGNALGAGSSELPGLYQAPRLSPSFLRVSGEEKSFGLNVIRTLNPTAMRITPQTIELLPNVNAGQSNMVRLRESKEAFRRYAQPGRSYIPFIKTEKESVIPAGTLLNSKDTRYYFNFENRKIPIREYDTVTSDIKGLKHPTLIKEASSYSMRISKPALVNPYTSTLVLSKVKLPKIYYNSNSSYSGNIIALGIDYKNSSSKSSKTSNNISSYQSVTSNLKSSYNHNILSKNNLMSKGSYLSSGSKGIIGRPLKLPPTVSRINLSDKKIKDKSDLNIGYITEVKRHGKFFSLPGIRGKEAGLSYGQKVATSTLAATFRVLPTNKPINIKSSGRFRPLSIFRDYKISSGKKIKLQDTFIQKKGKRLNFSPEVSELQRSRFKL